MGKSALGLGLAAALNGEIVNADAMALYRGMDIGTGKPTKAQRAEVTHHLLDELHITDEASVAVYQRKARNVIADIAARGRLPILVGGSGLYVKAVLEPLEFPGTDREIRQTLEDDLAEVGSVKMHERLAEVDPLAASAIDPQNGRRIVRALEVVQLTGSSFNAHLGMHQSVYRDVRVGLRADRTNLDDRISRRVVEMMKAGWLDEVSRLRAEGLADTRTAGRALGYQQLLKHLAGEYDLSQAVAETVTATKRFARRQESWFGRDSQIIWLDANEPIHSLIKRITSLWVG
jgi:tRNA dimethylallyltransferase